MDARIQKLLLNRPRTWPGLQILLPGLLFCFLAAFVCSSARADTYLQTPDLATQAGQMLMLGFRGLEPPDWILSDISQGRVGGIILFDYDVGLQSKQRNIQNAEQLTHLTGRLQGAARIPLLLAVDQEGGRVCRLKPRHGFPEFPGAEELGRIKDPARTERTASSMGDLLAGLGLNCNLAPVLDVNVNPQNPAIGRLGRSFSSGPEQVLKQAEAFVAGLEQSGVLGCLKHFPGHGSAFNDSHLGLTDITQTWSRQELLPFEGLIRKGKARLIMTGHLFNATLDPVYPATLSSQTINGLLREELGFSGVVISDDLQMKAITEEYTLRETVLQSIRAGVDILLFANNLAYDPRIAGKVLDLITEMTTSGEIDPSRIRQSFDRIMRLKYPLCMRQTEKSAEYTADMGKNFSN